MEHKLALEASAGSGKTFALSVRYVALVLQGAHPSKIVALTFTKKAANEMKERVKSTLEHLESKPAECEALSALLACDIPTVLALRDRALPVFWDAALAIETIDAYVARILRKFSLHHGILPDFSIGAQPETVGLLEHFLEAIERADKMAALAKFSALLRLSRNDVFALFAVLYEKECELEHLSFPPSPYPHEGPVLEAAAAICDFLEKANATPRSRSPFEPRTLKGLLEKSFWAKESLEYWDYKKLYTPELDVLFETLKEAYGVYARGREAFLLGELMALFDVYKHVRISLAKERNELTFTDVTNGVYRLLHQGLDREFLYFRLDGMVEHLLIDEFQDTNVAQYEILAPLIEEIVSGVGVKAARSFFYVGDVKQSIYRFRGGSQALFYEVARRFDVSVDALRTNYRSKEEVVTFVNNVFGGILAHYIPQATPPSAKGGMVEVVRVENPLEGVIERVGALLEAGVDADEIAVLTQTNDDATQVKEALQEAYEGLHVSTHSTLKLKDIPSVQALIECAKYSYFRAPLFWHAAQALSASDAPARVFSFDAPLERVFLKMVEYLGLDGSSLPIIAFLEAVAYYEDSEAFLFDLERFDVEAPTQQHVGVKVLTVHKSKGLEFGYVVVCDRLKGENNH
ncbi:MAG: UvrD-helicase domain-containing protein, partial [Campylobacterales bacterium]|nr:UvrD-helicase domain-containing protein [Campylobacterales bacterium]